MLAITSNGVSLSKHLARRHIKTTCTRLMHQRVGPARHHLSALGQPITIYLHTIQSVTINVRYSRLRGNCHHIGMGLVARNGLTPTSTHRQSEPVVKQFMVTLAGRLANMPVRRIMLAVTTSIIISSHL